MTDPSTFFDEPERGRGGVPRDSKGRALLVPKGLPKSAGIRVPYSSASGLADSISDDFHIHRWQMRYLAKAMGQRPDLGRLAAAEPYSTGLYAEFEPGEKARSGRALDRIIERALDSIGIDEKADYGTAFHAHTEPGAESVPPLDQEMANDVKSFERILEREQITIVDTERFTANDKTMSAGTFDHGVRVLGHPTLTGYVISDKKTGRVDPFHWEVQVASYAYGELYDTETDERSPFPADINLSWGLVFHTGARTGLTTLFPIDLERGWRNAQLAALARDAQEEKYDPLPFKPATFTQRLKACATKDDARRLWKSLPEGPDRDLVADKAASLP